MIRPATLNDVDSILNIALGQVHERYPRMKPDVKKMRALIVESVSSSKHFCWVSEVKILGVTGAIVGLVQNNFWAQRQCCNIPLWTSIQRGDGVRLLRELRNWVRSRRAIKVAGFAPDTDEIDPRVWKLAELVGFKRHGGSYLLYN